MNTRVLLAMTAFLTTALLISTSESLHAKVAMDAVQFENVPLDAGSNCRRTFFRSTQSFDGTLYVMPLVEPQADHNGRQEFKIESDEKGGYTLALGLYFPHFEEELADDLSADDHEARCNFDEVKESLNQYITDPKNKILRIAPMPLTSIEVIVPGVKLHGRIGRISNGEESADILDYSGKSLPVEIQLSTEEKDGINRRLNRVNGLPAQVLFRFQARGRDGDVTASIDWKQLAAGLQATVGAKRFLSQAEFSADLQAVLSSSSTSIKVNSGKSPSIEAVANQLVSMMIKKIESQPQPSANKPKAADGLIDLSVAFSVMESESSNTLHFEVNSPPEEATAESVIRFKELVQDPNLHEIKVRAGFADPSLETPIYAHQTIRITPTMDYLAKFNFKHVRKTILTDTQIQYLRLADLFPDVSSDQMVIQNQKVSGHLLAIGRWIPLGGYSPLYSPAWYTWKRIEKILDMDESALPKAIPADLSYIKRLPITVGFSAVGGQNTTALGDLVGENSLWSSTFDASTGSFLFTAKQDLGLMTFQEHFQANQALLHPGEIDLLYSQESTDEVQEERRFALQKATVIKTVDLRPRGTNKVMQSRYILLEITTPEKSK